MGPWSGRREARKGEAIGDQEKLVHVGLAEEHFGHLERDVKGSRDRRRAAQEVRVGDNDGTFLGEHNGQHRLGRLWTPLLNDIERLAGCQ